jgi:hypothetical protein
MRKITLLSFLLTCSSIVYCQEEKLVIPWPAETKWKIGSTQENPKQKFVEYIPEKESIDKWTIIGTMVTFKDYTNIQMDVAKNIVFSESKENVVDPVLTIIERGDDAKYPWIIFKIEAAACRNSPAPESQLVYIVQGEDNLYSNLVAIKEKALPDEFTAKWTKIFKASSFEH